MTDERSARLYRRITEPHVMRVDHDLIRLILLKAEAAQPVDLSAYTNEQIGYHMRHLINAGYATGLAYQNENGSCPPFTDITWKAHEFLANARNEIIWNRAKARVSQRGGSVSLEVLASVLTQVALEVLMANNSAEDTAE